jgi:hypothetical protein
LRILVTKHEHLFSLHVHIKVKYKPTKVKKILHVVLYGSKTWFLKLREEYTGLLKLFENRVFRRARGLYIGIDRRLEKTV